MRRSCTHSAAEEALIDERAVVGATRDHTDEWHSLTSLIGGHFARRGLTNVDVDRQRDVEENESEEGRGRNSSACPI